MNKNYNHQAISKDFFVSNVMLSGVEACFFQKSKDPSTSLRVTERSFLRWLGILFITILLLPSESFSQRGLSISEPGAFRLKVRKRLSAFPLLSFYSGDSRFYSNLQPKQGYGAQLDLDIGNDRRGRFLTGIGFYSQSLAFNSYYFADGYSAIYDRNFAYEHRVRINDIRIPVLLKYNFVTEEDYTNRVYVMFGLVLRQTFSGHAAVTDGTTGSELFNGSVDITSEHSMYGDKGGSMLRAGLGFENRIINIRHAVFLEVNYDYKLSRYEYPLPQSGYLVNGVPPAFFRFSNSSIAIAVGYKF